MIAIQEQLSPLMTTWLQQNLVADGQILQKLVERKLERFRQGNELEQIFWQITEAKTDFSVLSARLKELAKTDKIAVNAFLASASKVLLPVLPEQPFYQIKRQLETLQIEFDNQEDLITAQKQNQRLWEAKTLAKQGKVALAVKQVEQQLTQALPSKDSSKTEFLQVQVEQIAALDAVAKTDVGNNNVLKKATGQAIKRAIFISRQSKLKRQIKQENAKQAKAIINAIDLYKDINGQKNTLAARLRQIPETAASLDLMQRLHNQLPTKLSAEINQKIIKILVTERNQLLNKKLHPAARRQR